MPRHQPKKPQAVPTSRIASYTKRFDNIDVRKGVPLGLVHVEGSERRLCQLCSRLGIQHAPALIGFRHVPRVSGIVVDERDEERLREAMDADS